MAKKTVTNDHTGKDQEKDGEGDGEKKLVDLTGKRVFFVHVEKLEPATIIVDDGPDAEQRARQEYQKLRNFLSTRNPWTVRDVTDGQKIEAKDAIASDEPDIEVKV